jgi:hypothetical protein
MPDEDEFPDDGEDFLDEIMRERTAKNPVFPALVEAALRRRPEMRRTER